MLKFILGEKIAVYIRDHFGLMIISMILAACASLFMIVPAALLQPFIDQGMTISNDPVTWKIPWIAFDGNSWLSWHKTEVVLVESITPNKLLILLSLIAFLSVLGKSIAEYSSELCATAFSNRAVLSLRMDIFEKFVSLPLAFHLKRRSGELISRATADVGTMQGLIAAIFVGLIKHPLTAVIFLSYLLIKNYQMTLIVCFSGPVIIGIVRLFGRKLKKHAVRVQDAAANVTASYQESLLCLRVIHGFCKESFEIERFRGLAQELYKRIMKWNRWELGSSPAMDATVFLILPGVLILGKIHYEHTIGDLAAMAYAFSKAYEPVKKLSKVYNQIRTLQGSTKRVFAIMDTIPEIKDTPNAKILPRLKKNIEFKDVCFSYSSSEPILKNVSVMVNAGDMVAFVGSTGAGKSTLVDLLPRFYDVTSGSISIDGVDIRDVTLESLRKQIGIVSQKTLLFHASIAENIAYGQPDVRKDDIVAAAKVANAHSFIMQQPNGYDTIIGDQGVLLSGGQRQRIAIARAVFIDPAILILDEAASALDAESEKLVQNAIEKLQGGRTIIAVAHRLSTIIRSNRIYVLEAGEIVESGTLDELLALKGRFRQLYDMQFNNGTSSEI
jgi:ATP-binding cassette, subfamily B, bacterial MsbA